MSKRTMTHAEWDAEAKRRFGDNMKKWRFVCPCCGYVASIDDWASVGAFNALAFSCVGRWVGAQRDAFGKGKGPCNYAGGGLLGLNPVRVTFADGTHQDVFDFASDAEPAP